MTLLDQAIVVFTRLPRRERKALLPQRACAHTLHTSLILHTLRRVARVRAEAALVFVADGPLPASLEAALAKMRRPVHVLQQRGADFEARFGHALEDAAALGYRRLVAVGTDTPSMTTRDLERALAQPGPALGPSCDGGFYLVGLDAAHLDVLGALPWHQPDLLHTLMGRLRALDADALLLPRRADLDTPGDARRALSALVALVRRCAQSSLDLVAWLRRALGDHNQQLLSPQRAPLVAAPRGPPRSCTI